MYTAPILCFANSRKKSGTCVAGKVLTNSTSIGVWIRPVSSRPTHAIEPADRRYADGTYADLLHVIEISLLSHTPSLHQTENYLINPATPWKKLGTVTWGQVQSSLDTVPGPLWINDFSTVHGLNDKIPEVLLPGIADSLKLVNVADFTVHVAMEPGYKGAPGRRRVRGSFTLNGHPYRIAVTDQPAANFYLQQGDGSYAIGAATLCISLSEPEYAHAYKLVASVLTPYRCGT